MRADDRRWLRRLPRSFVRATNSVTSLASRRARERIRRQLRVRLRPTCCQYAASPAGVDVPVPAGDRSDRFARGFAQNPPLRCRARESPQSRADKPHTSPSVRAGRRRGDARSCGSATRSVELRHLDLHAVTFARACASSRAADRSATASSRTSDRTRQAESTADDEPGQRLLRDDVDTAVRPLFGRDDCVVWSPELRAVDNHGRIPTDPASGRPDRRVPPRRRASDGARKTLRSRTAHHPRHRTVESCVRRRHPDGPVVRAGTDPCASQVPSRRIRDVDRRGARSIAISSSADPKPKFTASRRKKPIDLVVVGSHGRHGLALLLGSTANGVLHGSPTDVLAVRVGSDAPQD